MPVHGATLIQDLGIVAAGAACASVIARKIRIPVFIAYMLVGLLLGTNWGGEPIIGDMAGISEVSELGVVFLLFFIGLEFDLARLRSLFAPAFLAVAAQTIAMLYLAHLIAPLFGWHYISSLFFGSVLAISSSMVTLRVLREQGRDKMPYAQLATGIMILEDVLAVLLLVILSGVAVSQSFDWHALWLVSFLMGVFVVGIFFLGRLLAPRLFAMMQGERNREALTVISCGLVLGIGALALKLHFSSALGAFVAGAILSRTKLVRTVLENNRSLRDLFSAVFFVTVGMQMDVVEILHNIGWVLILSVFVIAGKTASCFLGMFLSGQSAENSYNASAAKAQIGEFSFIIASMGASLGVTDIKGQTNFAAITFGIAFVSILLTPLISRTAPQQYLWLAAHTPRQISRFGEFYRGYIDSIRENLGRSRLLKLVRRPLAQICIYFFLISGIIIGGAYIARWVAHTKIASPMLWGLAVWICTAIVSVPFLIAIARNLSTIVFMVTGAVFENHKGHSILQGRVNNLVNTLATLLLLLVMGGFFLSVASPLLPRGAALSMFCILVMGICIFFWRRMIHINSRIEAMFMDSFAEDAHAAEERRHVRSIEKLMRDYPWPAGIREIRIGRESSSRGLRIRDLDLTTKTGSMIVALVRGGLEIFDPSPDIPLFPEDRIVLLGSEEANERASQLLEKRGEPAAGASVQETLNIERVILPHGCALDGNTLAGTKIRHRFGVSIVGIQRGAKQITTPRADELLKSGDMLLFVGDPVHSKAFQTFIRESSGKPSDDIPPAMEAIRKTDSL